MKTCPICGAKYTERPALSREDNKTEICPDCGVAEALKAVSDRRMSPQEKAKVAAMATGNRWVI